jgi:hypothetical protein
LLLLSREPNLAIKAVVDLGMKALMLPFGASVFMAFVPMKGVLDRF